jgi:hypothetical protein
MNDEYRVCTGEWHKVNKTLHNMTTPTQPRKKGDDSRPRKNLNHNSLS